MKLTVEKINSTTKTYRDDDGVLQALAISKDNFINYFCLSGVWQPQCDTHIVSIMKLGEMYKESVR